MGKGDRNSMTRNKAAKLFVQVWVQSSAGYYYALIMKVELFVNWSWINLIEIVAHWPKG